MPASQEPFLGRSHRVPATGAPELLACEAPELRRVKQRLVYLRVLREDVVDESFVARTQGAAAAAHAWKRGDRAGQRGPSWANPRGEVPLVENISLDSVWKPGKRTGHQADDTPEFSSQKKKQPREENRRGEAGNWPESGIV